MNCLSSNPITVCVHNVDSISRIKRICSHAFIVLQSQFIVLVPQRGDLLTPTPQYSPLTTPTDTAAIYLYFSATLVILDPADFHLKIELQTGFTPCVFFSQFF